MADGEMKDRASFTAMADGTAQDWATIWRASEYARGHLPDRLIAELTALAADHGGFAVDRLEHSLQTATRAHRDGRDEEYLVCALVHDIGDFLGPVNHAEIGAAILKPYVSEANHWMLEHHGVFQGYYFFHHLGLDRDIRERFRGHPHFEHTAHFCETYDQCAFDPHYDSMPLEAFEPMLRRVLKTPKASIYFKA
ncbi:HD domain-containing protein [Phenylobacterium sp.]|uniref:HD domain-containing protein n=1 Tax=Phenylobacterium sp. TaxID=1871053 RepID=UPI002F40ECA8